VLIIIKTRVEGHWANTPGSAVSSLHTSGP